jgi:hypothetical protein
VSEPIMQPEQVREFVASVSQDEIANVIVELLGGDDVMTKSAMPASVKVGAVRYRVLTDVEAIKEASDSSDAAERGGEWAAFSNHDSLVIGLNPDHADDANRYSLVHELLHCCLRQSNTWPDMYARVLDNARDRAAGIDVEELTVGGLSGPLLSVLRDNPDLLDWLVAS